jgi:hypothetical protein
MYPDISEFSYGYALTEELIYGSRIPVRAAPFFPSLIEEGTTGGGYDVAIPFVGFVLFLQFKLSDYMVRNTASEVKIGLMTAPFYRMHLRPSKHSRQHQLLLDLERKGELVYYAAPHFHRPEELNDAYLNREVVNRSVFFRPRTIGLLPDDDWHHVAFCDGQPSYLCSDPKRLRKDTEKSREDFALELVKGLEIRPRMDGTHQSTARLAAEMLDSVRKLAEPGEADGTRLDEIAERESRFQIAYLARAYFDCEILLIGPCNGDAAA